jgi:hypothetical protein
LWDKVQEKAFGTIKWTYSAYGCESQAYISLTGSGTSYDINYYKRKGYTIISAEEYLKEDSFQVGDSVECVRLAECKADRERQIKTGITVGSIHIIERICSEYPIPHFSFGTFYVHPSDIFKLATPRDERCISTNIGIIPSITTEVTMSKTSNVNPAIREVFGGKKYTGDQMLLVDKHYGAEITGDVLSKLALTDNADKVLKMAEKAEDDEKKDCANKASK